MADSADQPGRISGKRRKGWVAVLLTLLLTGLGQLYNGQRSKAVGYLLVSNLAPLVLILLPGRLLTLGALGALLGVQGVIQIAAITDAVRSARRIGNAFRPRWFNRFSIYLVTYLVFGLLLSGAFSWYVREHVVQAFKLPSASMEPTLLVGDHILVDKAASDYRRGDLVVFEFPPDAGKPEPREFIKRVVGLPGDVVEIRAKQLLVNGQPLDEPYAVHLEEQVLPAARSPRDFFGPVTVPEGSYFVLGDNRDRSFDSRFWGFVAQEKLRGRATTIYWSWDRRTFEVRWGRIGENVGSSARNG